MQESMYAEVCGLRTEPTGSEEICHSRIYSLQVSPPVSSAATLISSEKSRAVCYKAARRRDSKGRRI